MARVQLVEHALAQIRGVPPKKVSLYAAVKGRVSQNSKRLGEGPVRVKVRVATIHTLAPEGAMAAGFELWLHLESLFWRVTHNEPCLAMMDTAQDASNEDKKRNKEKERKRKRKRKKETKEEKKRGCLYGMCRVHTDTLYL